MGRKKERRPATHAVCLGVVLLAVAFIAWRQMSRAHWIYEHLHARGYSNTVHDVTMYAPASTQQVSCSVGACMGSTFRAMRQAYAHACGDAGREVVQHGCVPGMLGLRSHGCGGQLAAVHLALVLIDTFLGQVAGQVADCGSCMEGAGMDDRSPGMHARGILPMPQVASYHATHNADMLESYARGRLIAMLISRVQEIKLEL